MAGCAFFDLDRTLLKGASGPLITEALSAAGIVSADGIPGQGLIYKVFDLVGETLPSMALARGAALAAKGWSRAAVREAGKVAAERLDDDRRPLRPAAARRAPRRRAQARAGDDDALRPHPAARRATRLRRRRRHAVRAAADGDTYTGALEGGFVWSRGKLDAVKALGGRARRRPGRQLRLLRLDLRHAAAVGRRPSERGEPRCEAARLRRAAPLAGPAPRRAPGHPEARPFEPADLLKLTARPEFFPYARFDIDGTDRIPRRALRSSSATTAATSTPPRLASRS